MEVLQGTHYRKLAGWLSQHWNILPIKLYIAIDNIRQPKKINWWYSCFFLSMGYSVEAFDSISFVKYSHPQVAYLVDYFIILIAKQSFNI